MALQRPAPEPKNVGAEGGGDQGNSRFVRGDLAPFDENLLIQRHADRLSRLGLRRGRLDVEGFNGADQRRFVRRRKDQAVPDFHATGGDPTRDDPTRVELVDVLHREPQRLLPPRRFFLEEAELIQHGRPLVPGHLRAARRDIVAQLGADGDDPLGDNVELREKISILLLDGVEDVLAETDQVHLVDDHGHLLHAEHGQEVPVLLRLLLHALERIDEQQRGLGPGGARDHVLQELLVPRRVDHDVLPSAPAEESAGRVDRDALFLFLQEGVEQEGVLELLTLLTTNGPHLVELAVGQRAGVGIEPAQQRGLAMIHVSDDHDIHRLRVRSLIGIRHHIVITR